MFDLWLLLSDFYAYLTNFHGLFWISKSMWAVYTFAWFLLRVTDFYAGRLKQFLCIILNFDEYA